MAQRGNGASGDARSAPFRDYRYGWVDPDSVGDLARRGLDETVVRAISAAKNEPGWMLALRLEGLSRFRSAPMPRWGPVLSGLDLDAIKYFVRSTDRPATTWDDLPVTIRQTYERLGIPEAERQKLIAGVVAQYASEAVYHSIRADLAEQGVLFVDLDTALQQHEDLVREHYGTVVPVGDNRFAALNAAVWSGGSFVYVPKGVEVDIPLQAYYRINTENMGQFERTLIVVDEGASVQVVEGCTAPVYTTSAVNAAVTEVIVKPGARCRCTTIQNWSGDVYNLVTRRAVCHQGASVEWIDGNLGSRTTMKYPSIILAGERATGEVLSLAMAGAGQHHDTGARIVHAAPHTSSTVVAKSVVRGGGRSSYRGIVRVLDGAHHARSSVTCDTLLLDDQSRSDTYPHVDARDDEVELTHEATASRVSAEQIFYLMSRGMTEESATAMIVRGFIEPVARQLPMEYALELNRLIGLQMEGSVG